MMNDVLPKVERSDRDWLSPVILETVRFTIDAHKNQTRKDGSPYWFHPFRVWQNIRDVLDIRDHAIECAALCHDVIEDTDRTFHDIAALCGEPAALIVCDLTNDGSIPKRERKEQMITKALHIDNRARIIKCFDRIDNLADGVTTFTPNGIWHYTKEAVLLHRNLLYGLTDDEWTEKATKAIKLLGQAIDNVASYCHNTLKIDEFAESLDEVREV